MGTDSDPDVPFRSAKNSKLLSASVKHDYIPQINFSTLKNRHPPTSDTDSERGSLMEIGTKLKKMLHPKPLAQTYGERINFDLKTSSKIWAIRNISSLSF